LTNILEKYAQIVEFEAKRKDPKTGRSSAKKTRVQIFPRYHQLDCVRELLADVPKSGLGRRYLVQYSAGSGKSNSIAWLAHQLIGIEYGGKQAFDTVVVVTDRRILDQQIRETIKQFAQVSSTIGADSEGSRQYRAFLVCCKSH